MEFSYKKSFLKAFDRNDSHTQKLIIETDKEIKNYLETGKASFGLRIKKITRRSYEGRVSDKVRIVWARDKDFVSFVMVGNHTEVQNYLRSFRK